MQYPRLKAKNKNIIPSKVGVYEGGEMTSEKT